MYKGAHQINFICGLYIYIYIYIYNFSKYKLIVICGLYIYIKVLYMYIDLSMCTQEMLARISIYIYIDKRNICVIAISDLCRYDLYEGKKKKR